MKNQPVKEKMTTIGEGGKRFWLYPAAVEGMWMNRRRITAYVLMLIFFIVPWTSVGGHQTVLLDIPNRKFAFFGIVLWPQDSLIFWFYLVGTVICIFLITAQWGRLWCGWACPQTVFMEHIFRRVEIWIEGDAPARRRLDNGPWTMEKIRKKTLKYGIFLIASSHFANTVLCYFVGSQNVVDMTLQPPAENWGWFTFMAFFNFLFFIDFAWFREQFCLIACPYGRFQSVLLDKDSLIVGYDYNRGEPRGVMRKSQERTEGDCIDCNRCVAVCPTGIDIRMGLQMECVNCTACMDACDNIMDKINKPKGLIGYTSEKQLHGEKRKFVRPRTIVYATMLTVLWSVGTFMLINRNAIIIRMVRPPGQSFTLAEDSGVITNHFQVKASNKTAEPMVLEARIGDGYELITALNPWTVPAQETAQNQIFVRRAKETFAAEGKERVTVDFYSGDQLIERAEVTILGPQK